MPKILKVKLNTHTMITLGILISLEIVFSRFLSFSVWNMKIGLSFIPIVLAAMLLGPLHAGIVGALADFLGAILFPVGPYFPGFTLTAFLMGMVFGLFLKEKQHIGRIFLAVCINQLVLSLLLNSFWISILYTTPFATQVVTRSVQTAILIPIQIVLTTMLSKVMRKTDLRKVAA